MYCKLHHVICSIIFPFVVLKNGNLIEYDVLSTCYVTDIILLLKNYSVYAKPYIKVLASNVGKKLNNSKSSNLEGITILEQNFRE